MAKKLPYKVNFLNFIGGTMIVMVCLVAFMLHGVGSNNEDYSFTVNFTRSLNMSPNATAIIAEVIAIANHNDNYEIILEGHTGVLGNEDANIKLSEQRAQVIKDYLVDQGIQNQISIQGLGGSSPVEQLNGESDRDWNRRNSRVNIIVYSDL